MSEENYTIITLQERLELLEKLRVYLNNPENTEEIKQRAFLENGWFVPSFIQLAINNIVAHFLQPGVLRGWVENYHLPCENNSPKTVGIVMAGNIPLVGFHDFLCGFISGHKLVCKLSSKDKLLITHIAEQLIQWDGRVAETVVFAERLTGCDAYIATGSNNSSRYFEYYFRNYPAIIRKNRTSVAVLTGNETNQDLGLLADDMLLYFGFGCRNVSKLYIPESYDFIPVLNALNKYRWMEDISKFKNNYDYNLSLHILNNQFYMTNGTLLLVENKQVFAPISQVNFEFYKPGIPFSEIVAINNDIQCVVGKGYTEFGEAQSPSLTDYADGIDTLQFLRDL
jgi:hypothetical protein